MSDSKKEAVENEQENNNKVKIAYDKNISKLVAIVGGKENLYASKKVKKDVIGTIVTGLLEDRKKSLEVTIKADLIALLEKKVTCDKEIKKSEDELAKLKIQKNKEFNEAAAKVFSQVDGIEQLEKDYYDSLVTATPNS